MWSFFRHVHGIHLPPIPANPPPRNPTPPGSPTNPRQANQRLEQALSRSTESEKALVELGHEADSLRDKLSAALASNIAKGNVDGDGGGNAATERVREMEGGGGDSANEHQEGGGGEGGGGIEGSSNGAGENVGEDIDHIAAAAAGNATADVERARATLARDLEAASSRLNEETANLRRAELTCSGLERQLSLERSQAETNSGELRGEIEALLERVKGAEKGEEEAMKAAATEARRAAEVREDAEGAQTELAWLRARLAEAEEESERAAELKGTLEVTRDALDELRWGSGRVYSFHAWW